MKTTLCSAVLLATVVTCLGRAAELKHSPEERAMIEFRDAHAKSHAKSAVHEKAARDAPVVRDDAGRASADKTAKLMNMLIKLYDLEEEALRAAGFADGEAKDNPLARTNKDGSDSDEDDDKRSAKDGSDSDDDDDKRSAKDGSDSDDDDDKRSAKYGSDSDDEDKRSAKDGSDSDEDDDKRSATNGKNKKAEKDSKVQVKEPNVPVELEDEIQKSNVHVEINTDDDDNADQDNLDGQGNGQGNAGGKPTAKPHKVNPAPNEAKKSLGKKADKDSEGQIKEPNYPVELEEEIQKSNVHIEINTDDDDNTDQDNLDGQNNEGGKPTVKPKPHSKELEKSNKKDANVKESAVKLGDRLPEIDEIAEKVHSSVDVHAEKDNKHGDDSSEDEDDEDEKRTAVENKEPNADLTEQMIKKAVILKSPEEMIKEAAKQISSARSGRYGKKLRESIKDAVILKSPDEMIKEAAKQISSARSGRFGKKLREAEEALKELDELEQDLEAEIKAMRKEAN